MKKVIKISIASVLAIVVILGAVAFTFALIKVRPMNDFKGYEKVAVVDYLDDAGVGRTDNISLIEKGLKTVEFSKLEAYFSGNLNYKIKLDYRPVNEGGDFVVFPEPEEDDEPVTFDGINARAQIRPATGEYMLRFDYATAQTHSRFKDENGNKIEYNMLLMIIQKSNGKIQTVRLYPLMSSQLSVERYLVYQFSAKMYTSKLYDKIHEELDDGNTDPDLGGGGTYE